MTEPVSRDELMFLLGVATQALTLIAAQERPDGTYNRDRNACRELADETLKRIWGALNGADRK